MVAYGRLNKKENLKLLALKAIAVAYQKWSVTKGPKYSDLTWNLENWSLRIGGVDAYERWSQPEVRL